jgi:hypothetical protein
MFDYTEEEIDMIVTRDFYVTIEKLPTEVLEQVKMKIEVEMRERDLAKENV